MIIIFLHGLGRLTCSGIDALPSFLGASTVSSSSRFVVEGVFRESGVVRSFKVVDPVLFVFESRVLYSRDLSFFSYGERKFTHKYHRNFQSILCSTTNLKHHSNIILQPTSRLSKWSLSLGVFYQNSPTCATFPLISFSLIIRT